jgi:hypothetical protein
MRTYHLNALFAFEFEKGQNGSENKATTEVLGFEQPLMFLFFGCGFRNGRFGFGNEGLDRVGAVFDVISKESSPPLGGLVFKKELELFLKIGL